MTENKVDWCHTCKKMTAHEMRGKGNYVCCTCTPRKENPAKPIKKNPAKVVKKKRLRSIFTNTRITADMAAEILEKRLSGVRTEDLAIEYGVSVQTIQDHTRGFTATKAMIIKWIDERIAEGVK